MKYNIKTLFLIAAVWQVEDHPSLSFLSRWVYLTIILLVEDLVYWFWMAKLLYIFYI